LSVQRLEAAIKRGDCDAAWSLLDSGLRRDDGLIGRV